MICGRPTLQQRAPLAGEYQKVLFCNIEATEEETNNAGNIEAMCSAGREQLLREGIDQVCQGAAHWDTRLDTAHCKLEYCAVQSPTLRYSLLLQYNILHTGILSSIVY